MEPPKRHLQDKKKKTWGWIDFSQGRCHIEFYVDENKAVQYSSQTCSLYNDISCNNFYLQLSKLFYGVFVCWKFFFFFEGYFISWTINVVKQQSSEYTVLSLTDTFVSKKNKYGNILQKAIQNCIQTYVNDNFHLHMEKLS